MSICIGSITLGRINNICIWMLNLIWEGGEGGYWAEFNGLFLFISAKHLLVIDLASILELLQRSGLTFILARNVSMLETAVWKTSEGRSYQTLRHLRTCEDPSLMPGEIPPPAPGERRPRTSSPDSRESSWWSSGWTSITTWGEEDNYRLFLTQHLNWMVADQTEFEGKINRMPTFKYEDIFISSTPRQDLIFRWQDGLHTEEILLWSATLAFSEFINECLSEVQGWGLMVILT